METTSTTNTAPGVTVGVNVSIDKKTIGLLAVALLVAMIGALMVYRSTL